MRSVIFSWFFLFLKGKDGSAGRFCISTAPDRELEGSRDGRQGACCAGRGAGCRRATRDDEHGGERASSALDWCACWTQPSWKCVSDSPATKRVGGQGTRINHHTIDAEISGLSSCEVMKEEFHGVYGPVWALGEGAVSKSVGSDEGAHDRAFALNYNLSLLLQYTMGTRRQQARPPQKR